MKEFRVLSPTAILGYGFPVQSFANGMDCKPDVIAVDAGSTDPGPYYLGAGKSFTDRQAVKRDLAIMLQAGMDSGIPVIVGTAGGSGAKPHLDWCLDIVIEIAREHDLHFRMAVIPSDFDKELLTERLRVGAIKVLEPGKPLTEKDIRESTSVVGQMGMEPVMEALAAGSQVVVTGRCYDPAVFAAAPVLAGFDRGLAVHMGKILECAAIAATPGSGSDCMIGYLRSDHFLLEPLNPTRKCTTTSVAAHTLYEKTNPYLLPGPGGSLDLRQTKFIQESENTVRVSGSRFLPAPVYTIKLEGARKVGNRAVSIAGARDPVFIREIDTILAGVRDRVTDNFSDIPPGTFHLLFHVYGRNGVMGELEPVQETCSHELGIVIEAVAPTQRMANTICSFARSTMLHYGYPGRLATAGNLAFPYSPSDFEAGEVYQFSIHHLLEVEDPTAAFPIQYREV